MRALPSLTGCYALTRHDHQRCQSNSKRSVLTKIEEGQTGSGLEGCLFVLSKDLVILSRLKLFIVEVLADKRRDTASKMKRDAVYTTTTTTYTIRG